MTPEAKSVTPTVFYRRLNVEGLEIFYREAGLRDAPTVLPLHGFPSSSQIAKVVIEKVGLAKESNTLIR